MRDLLETSLRPNAISFPFGNVGWSDLTEDLVLIFGDAGTLDAQEVELLTGCGTSKADCVLTSGDGALAELSLELEIL